MSEQEIQITRLEEEIQRLKSIINDLAMLAEERHNFNEADLIRHRLAGGDRDFGPFSKKGKRAWAEKE